MTGELDFEQWDEDEDFAVWPIFPPRPSWDEESGEYYLVRPRRER